MIRIRIVSTKRTASADPEIHLGDEQQHPENVSLSFSAPRTVNWICKGAFEAYREDMKGRGRK